MSEQKDNWSEPIVWDDLTPREVPVKVAGQDYVLVEPSATDAKAWRANNMQALQMREKGKGKQKESTSMFDARIADSHIILVSLCLRKIEPGGNRTRVTTNQICEWPNALVESLFDRAKLLGQISDDDEEDDAKNSSGVTSP